VGLCGLEDEGRVCIGICGGLKEGRCSSCLGGPPCQCQTECPPGAGCVDDADCSPGVACILGSCCYGSDCATPTPGPCECCCSGFAGDLRAQCFYGSCACCSTAGCLRSAPCTPTPF
jgi:hypothetical protein